MMSFPTNSIKELESEIERLTTENRQQRDTLVARLARDADHMESMVSAASATINHLEVRNQDLTRRLSIIEAKLAQTWQPIDTETKFDSPWAGPNLIVEEGGDILTMEAKLRGPSVKLPDGVRLCRLVAK